MIKIAIIGSRNWGNPAPIHKYIDTLKGMYGNSLIIVSGGARGVDTIAQRYAEQNKISTDIYRAEWDKHGKSAGMIRNREIVKVAHYVIAFWDEESAGTKNMIKISEHRLGADRVIVNPHKNK